MSESFCTTTQVNKSMIFNYHYYYNNDNNVCAWQCIPFTSHIYARNGSVIIIIIKTTNHFIPLSLFDLVLEVKSIKTRPELEYSQQLHWHTLSPRRKSAWLQLLYCMVVCTLQQKVSKDKASTQFKFIMSDIPYILV